MSIYISSSQSIQVKIFAESVKVYEIYNSDSPSEAYSELEISIGNLTHYSSVWNLTVNLDKCYVMHIGKEAISKINGILIKNMLLAKVLVVMIDHELSFSEHISHVVKKAYALRFLPFRNIHTDKPLLVTRLYKTFDLPSFEFCSHAWKA